MDGRGVKVFISYRRAGGGGHVDYIHEWLCRRFGHEAVFRDVDNIPGGSNLLRVIQQSVVRCDVLLAVIGPDWLDARNLEGRRLDDPEDFVRMEISSALASDVAVLPVLVDGAKMPAAKDLPSDMAALARTQAVTFASHRPKDNFKELLRALPGPWWRVRRVRLRVALALLLIGVVSAAVVLRDSPEPTATVTKVETITLSWGEQVAVEIRDLPDGSTVWYVVRPDPLPGMAEKFQPDAPPTRAGPSTWVGPVYAGDVGSRGGRYELLVVLASEAANREFQTYLEVVAVTEAYTGMPRLPNGARTIATLVVDRD